MYPRRTSIAFLCFALIGATQLHADEKKAGKKADKKEWNVDEPGGPQYDVTIDTDEGTWLSVDVSPDGQEIAFDLLGDIYLLSVTGDARPLTSGVSWDMQPRYSPDGRWIAFTSDRGGGDNIWIMDRQGKNLQQVTKESFRLLNSPVWTPDSQYIAARKHFSSRRSLGAGEIWLYHRSGGSGVQLIAKPNDQKDLGEPAFSPDGRYLYYSRDATAGSTFEYNKDSTTGIYKIFRLDRHTGRVETYLSGTGGAIRPTPSPDGKSIAFVRRVRFRSMLFVHDIESGAERIVYENLERDMQETWAIHGVYPTMGWTPDSKSLVFWARGKIRRVDVATKESKVIPFRIRDKRTVQRALRVPIEVAPSKFDAKMIRWTEVSPTGKEAVFQALGYVWVRSLPDGKPRRLTTQRDHFEYYPTFSRDGKKVAYAAWNDESLGSIVEVDLKTGSSRVLSQKPGHYIEPAYSPDGANILYRKVSGGYLRSGLWSRDTGIYLRATTGGDEKLLVRNGSEAHFGESSDIVFFTTSDSGKRALARIRTDKTDRHVLLTSDNATQFRCSPDSQWVAFTERFHAYIVPLIEAGKPIAVSPNTKSIPQAKVARDAGEYLHWSGNSEKLHWTLGSQLFSRDLRSSFSFLDGAPKKSPELENVGRELGLRVRYDEPRGRIALVGARIITMRKSEIIENGVVLIRGNRIAAVGKKDNVTIPPGTKVIDATGTTILPGLVDVHAHGSQGTNEIIPQQNWISHSVLSFGVTTIHDPSADTSTIFAASEMAKAGHILSPRVFSTGTILYGAAGSFKAEVDSLEDARFHLRRMKAVGAFSVKSYN
ncbi:MAG: amidohydrolase, partial [Planctomycetota bacterium]